jgi:hypothetical protein
VFVLANPSESDGEKTLIWCTLSTFLVVIGIKVALEFLFEQRIAKRYSQIYHHFHMQLMLINLHYFYTLVIQVPVLFCLWYYVI